LRNLLILTDLIVVIIVIQNDNDDIIVAAVVAAECVIQESVLKDVKQKEFHIQKIVIKRLKKKTKQKTTC